MSLQKQLVHLNMSGGLEKKDDSFLTIPSKLAVADNVQFDDASTVVRRGGQASQALTSVSVIEAASTALRAFNNGDEAVLEAASGDYRVVPAGVVQLVPLESSGNGAPRVFTRAAMTTRRVGAILPKASVAGAGYPLYDQNHDSAVVGDTMLSAWEARDPSTGFNTIRYQISTAIEGRVLRSGMLNTLLSKVRVQPRVLAVGDKLVLYFGIFTAGANTYEIRRIAWDATGALANAEAVVATSSAGAALVESATPFSVLFDVALSYDAASLGLVYRDVDAARTLRFRGLSTADFSTVTQTANVAPSAVPTSLTALVSKNAATYRVHAIFGVGTNLVRGINMNQGTAALSAETTLGTGAAAAVTMRAAASQAADNGTITLAYDSTEGYVSALRLSTFSEVYAGLAECATFSPWLIAGRIAIYNSRMYLPMMFSASASTAFNTTYIIDLTSAARNVGVANNSQPPHVVARMEYGEGSIFRSSFSPHMRVPSCVSVTSGIAVTYTRFEADLVFAGVQNDTPPCLSVALLDFTSQLGHREVNGVTVLAGGCPLIYDGRSVVEEGFHHAPFLDTVFPAAAGTYGPFPVGDVTLCFTVGWQDERGNWHESAPSNERIVTFAGANVYCTPTLALPPTQKRGALTRIYRSKATSTDTSLYLSQSTAGAFIATDTDLANSEQIYTAGNVLPNTPAPACRHISLWQRRLVLSGCGDGQRVHWSKQSDPGYGVEFSAGDPTHQSTVPASKGRVVATEEMDDRLVVICESGVGIIDGQGPNPSGTQGQYSEYRSIITEVGCDWDSPKSVIRGPEGVWFRSPKGIRLVSRSGSLAVGQDGKQVGSEVDAVVSGTVVGVAGDAKQQTRFYQSSGTCLVWDYQWRQWTRFTGTENIDAVYADDRYYHLSNYSVTTPLLRYTDDAVSTDVLGNGTPSSTYGGYIETAWLSFAGIQGFQRVYRLMVLGRNVDGSLSPVSLGIALNYDFDPTYAADAPLVSVTPSTGGVVQLQHHFVKQKCEAIKITVYFGPAAGGTGRFRLTDLTLQVGVKSGYFKQPSTARF